MYPGFDKYRRLKDKT